MFGFLLLDEGGEIEGRMDGGHEGVGLGRKLIAE